MPDEHSFTLHQVDQARSDFAVLESELEFVKAQLALLPTRRNMLDLAALVALWTAALVLLGEWVLLR